MEANPCAHDWGLRISQEVEVEVVQQSFVHATSEPLTSTGTVALAALDLAHLPSQELAAMPKGWAGVDSVRGPPVYWSTEFQQRADHLEWDHNESLACIEDPFAWPNILGG